MISNIDPRHQKPPAALTNNYFPAMNLSFSFLHEKTSDCSYENMQNEPNLNNWIFALSSFMKVRYPCLDTWYRGKNEPKTNPNEPIFEKTQKTKTTKSEITERSKKPINNSKPTIQNTDNVFFLNLIYSKTSMVQSFRFGTVTISLSSCFWSGKVLVGLSFSDYGELAGIDEYFGGFRVEDFCKKIIDFSG